MDFLFFKSVQLNFTIGRIVSINNFSRFNSKNSLNLLISDKIKVKAKNRLNGGREQWERE